MKNISQIAVFTLFAFVTSLVNAQIINDQTLKSVIDSNNTVKYKDIPINITAIDSQAYTSIISGTRIGMKFHNGEAFTINNISQLIKLKEALDILPRTTNFTNGNIKHIPGDVGMEPIPCNTPFNNILRNEQKLSIGFTLSGIMPLASVVPEAAFEVKLFNKCSNSITTSMHVGDDNKIGFGTNTPQVSYHFNNLDLLVGNTNGYSFRVGNENNRPHMVFSNNGDRLFVVNKDGKVFAKEFEVLVNIPVPDYVFENDYKLMPLNELRTYLEQNKHLPGMKSAADIESEGVININEMQMTLLKKVEELTLYILHLKEITEDQKTKIDTLQAEINKFQKHNK